MLWGRDCGCGPLPDLRPRNREGGPSGCVEGGNVPEQPKDPLQWLESLYQAGHDIMRQLAGAISTPFER